MATTTNYGWTTPDDTALVKDGASAIRTLGSSVDTTTKNLNPETTLGDLSFRSSTSNVNTRIPIGSSGQHLTVVAGVPAWATASDQTPLTTKGDLLGFSTLDARIPIGANDTVLTADSTESLGLKWAAPAAAGFVGAKVFTTANQTISNNTQTTVNFNSEDFDTNTFHDNSTNNSRLTIPAGKGGYYAITGQIILGSAAAEVRQQLKILKNGSMVLISEIGGFAGSVQPNISVATIVNLAATDYVELALYQATGSNMTIPNTANSAYQFFQVQFLGA